MEELNEKEKNEIHFLSLIFSLQATAMYQLGKTINPITNKIERDLNQARITIDIIKMLKEKTIGNLTDKEKRTIETILSELQMNYVDEITQKK